MVQEHFLTQGRCTKYFLREGGELCEKHACSLV